MPTRDPPRRPHDGTRTRIEARVAFPTLEEEDEIAAPTRRFTVWETTSGLPDDSREADERQEERRLRDLRARVKRARALVATVPGLVQTLSGDWRKAACFYTRFRITETPCRCGVRSGVFESDGALRTSPAISTRPGTGGFTETWQAMGMSLADASP